MSGGGKGGSTTSQVKIPPWLELAAQNNIMRANQVANIGYVPYYGPDVAAFSPMQQSAFQNTADAASAFGMATQPSGMAGMPQAQTFAGGVQGYSSAPMYDAALARLKAERPGQYKAITDMFIDPITGKAPQALVEQNALLEKIMRQLKSASARAPSGPPPTLGMTGSTGVESMSNRTVVPPATNANTGYNTNYTTINTPLSYLPGGVNDPFLKSGLSQSIAKLSNNTNGTVGGSLAPVVSQRPAVRPINLNTGTESMSNRSTNVTGGTIKGNTLSISKSAAQAQNAAKKK